MEATEDPVYQFLIIDYPIHQLYMYVYVCVFLRDKCYNILVMFRLYNFEKPGKIISQTQLLHM